LKRWTRAALGAAVLVLAATPAQAADRVVEVAVDDRAELERLIERGGDLDHGLTQRDGKTVVEIVADDAEIEDLRADGFDVGRTVYSDAVAEQRIEQRERQIAAEDVSEAEGVKILRAQWYTSQGNQFLHVEAKAASRTDDLTVRWDSGPGTEMGSGGTGELDDFTELGVYLYHTETFNQGDGLDERPSRIELTNERTGAVVTKAVEEWLPVDESNRNDPYLTGFTGERYLDATETSAKIMALAEEFPELSEIVELPNETNGYRRKAQTLFGTLSTSRNSQDPRSLYLTSHAWGHEGGNLLRAQLKDPGAANRTLSVEVSGQDIVVNLATNASSAVTSTAAQVVSAINASAAASGLVTASLTRGNTGAGVVVPTADFKMLDDDLDAPASISREPFTVRALRIGKKRDGSKLGVLAYSQEHAREWQTPLVTLEAAERLLRNYAHDGETKQLLNNLDIFIVPTVNPDGSHFSFYDRSGQRKNMTNHCAAHLADPVMAGNWGVDVNRNYDFGTVFDGYSGALRLQDDSNRGCVNDTFAGPERSSEAESRNIMWLADTFENIKFSMNIHSSGNFFMWSPGAYKAQGRETLPRPTLGQETFFWAASQQILSAIKEYRGLSVPVSRTGPIVDVLYSAAGNSGDRLWYQNGIYAWNFEVGTSFQPNQAEAYAEAQEFANGLVEMMGVAYQFTKDHQPPKADLVQRGDGFGFSVSEPATVFYTTDGSDPATSATRKLYANVGVRDTDGETVAAPAGTQVRWFAADAAGNRSNAKKATLGG
jgi:hypothetical protein